MKTDKLKNWWRYFLLLLVILFSILLVYVAYVYLSYHRVADNQRLSITHKTEESELSLDHEYKVTTYNIGYGSYPPDYTFFMDGGEKSKAESKQSVVEAIDGAISTIQSQTPDFALFQEVDEAATRSRKVDEVTQIGQAFTSYDQAFAVNYDSAYLMYPILDPIGKSKSGLLTLSNTKMIESRRYSLPIETNFNKFFDLDRAFTVSEIPVENGRSLMLYNVHLSAYLKDEAIQKKQLRTLFDQMEKEYKKGNYVLCGGDFNHDLLTSSNEIFENDTSEDYSWLQRFPKEELPAGLEVVTYQETGMVTPSVRNLDKPYIEGESFVALIDGFILSKNIKAQKIAVVDTGFLYSDHNPVELSFRLMQ
ncbi:exonuclease/endonuclease/phosphatase family protein [Enterococcus sp. LJL99]